MPVEHFGILFTHSEKIRINRRCITGFRTNEPIGFHCASTLHRVDRSENDRSKRRREQTFNSVWPRFWISKYGESLRTAKAVLLKWIRPGWKKTQTVSGYFRRRTSSYFSWRCDSASLEGEKTSNRKEWASSLLYWQYRQRDSIENSSHQQYHRLLDPNEILVARNHAVIEHPD